MPIDASPGMSIFSSIVAWWEVNKCSELINGNSKMIPISVVVIVFLISTYIRIYIKSVWWKEGGWVILIPIISKKFGYDSW